LKEVTEMATKTFKPGQIVPQSGQAEMLNTRGNKTGIERTVVKNEPFPPTRKPNWGFLHKPTKRYISKIKQSERILYGIGDSIYVGLSDHCL